MHKTSLRISIDFFLPQVKVGTRREVLALIAEEMAAHLSIEKEDLFSALIDHEQKRASGVGNKIAIMHLPLGCLSRPQSMLLTFLRPVHFNASDNYPAEIFYLLVTPQKDNSFYLPDISRMTRILTSPMVQGSIISAKNLHSVKMLIEETRLLKAA